MPGKHGTFMVFGCLHPSPMKTPPLLLSAAALLCLLTASGAQAAAGIFGFVDDDGVEHLSNIPDDRRYRLVLSDRDEARTPLGRPSRGLLALPLAQRPFHEHIQQASSDTGVDAALLHAVITVESGYNPGAVSSKGATGLMQLIPATARRYGTRNLLDPAENIRAGARYLKDLLVLFDNNLDLALAAYNAGENSVLRHGRRIPPYAETRRYVPMVVAHYNRNSDRRSN